ncbi:MAG: hypothetical protein ACR2JE_01065 [Acidobacteriaceae bacterium]
MSNSHSVIRGFLLAAFSLISVPQLFATTISPANPTVKEAAKQQFTASTAVTWKTSCSSITSGGLFTASVYPGPCTVTATATNGSGSASTTVNVVSPITMTPLNTTTPQNQKQQFTASIPVTWTAKCGSITAGGLYTASGAVGTRCTIEAIGTASPHYTVWGSDTATKAGSTFFISPVNPSVVVSKTQQFAATASATWAASCGSITSSGLFTAPSTAGSCTITATNSSGTKASTTATITAAASFSVSPTTVSLTVHATQQFTATAPATWATSCGSITSSGYFTAPSTTGSCTITATSSSGAKATARATITGAVTGTGFIIYPNSAYVLTGTRQTFQGQFTNEAPDTHPLNFSVDGIAGGSGTVGTITSAGLYTPPSSAGRHTVTAKDTSTGLSASATVTVYSQVAVNFGSRTTTSYPVPAYLLGAERMDGLYHQADLDLVTAAGVKTARFYAQIPVVFKTQTPNWGSIDSTVREMSTAGVHVLLQMHQTPPWLQTSPSTCTGTAAALSAPSSVSAWGKIAAQYVAHMDATFPGVVTDYEIWNEPNTNALCGVTTYDQKNAFYQTLFAAAAPLMEAQAKADHANIRVGGPATAGLQPAWVKALLSNPKTAPYVQFMSYHDYMFNGGTLNAQWDTYNGTYPVYELTQNTGGGPYGKYLSAVALAKAGSQPSGSQLPLYLTEYNMNSSFSKNCCQNDYTFAPVWNGIYVSDLLNAAYAGVPTGISKMIYFAANAKPYFCLIGTIDSNMDCAYTSTTPPQPYPSYFLYQLFFSPTYLGLESGGHMASSITPGNSGGGLVVTAFYNAAQDAIVITNPTAQNYSSVPVSITNSGYSSGTAKLYQITNGRSISASSLSLTSAGGTSYTAHIPVPPYSVQAISVK